MPKKKVVTVIEETPEMKNEKFKRYSMIRVNGVVDGLRKVSNLSNKNTYSYSDEEVEKIFEIIDNAVAECKNSFKSKFAEELKW